MKKPDNLEILYENNTLRLEWQYSITRHTHKTQIANTTTQFVINLNNTIQQLAKIRRVLFLYQHEGVFYLTTAEPEDEVNYETILTRSNKVQTTIQLPQEYLGLKKSRPQSAKIALYPQEKDPLTQNTPKLTLEIIENEEDDDNYEMFMGDENVLFLRWNIVPHEGIPAQLMDFLTTNEIEDLESTLIPKTATLNTRTLDVEIVNTSSMTQDET